MSDKGSNVIFLQFRSPHVETDGVVFHCCGHCRNKTFTLIEDKPNEFPMMRCAACGNHMGRMGFWHDDQPKGGGDVSA